MKSAGVSKPLSPGGIGNGKWVVSAAVRSARAESNRPRMYPYTLSSVTQGAGRQRSEEHTSELQSQSNLVCRLLLEKKKKTQHRQETDDKFKEIRCSGWTHT